MLAFVTLAVALARALSSIDLTDAYSPVLTQELIDAVNSRTDVKDSPKSQAAYRRSLYFLLLIDGPQALTNDL